MPFNTCEVCLTEHFDELPCPNCETSIDLSEVEEAKPIGFISDETRQWVLDENGRGPGTFTPNRNGAGGVWAIYGGWEYKRLLAIAQNLQKQCVLMHGVVAAARTLYEETEEYDFPDGMGKGALQEYWNALADALEPELDAALKAAQPVSDERIAQIYAGETGFDLRESPAALLDFARALLREAQPDQISNQLSGNSGQLNASEAQPEGWVSVPREPTDELLTSMAIRYDHGLGVSGYYDSEFMKPIAPEGHTARMEATKRTMRQLHEEVVGTGFYRPAAPKGTR